MPQTHCACPVAGPMSASLTQPELVERLIAVDISPVETTSHSDFPSYVAAMRAIDIPDEVSRSSARKLADQQLSAVIQVTYPCPGWCCGLGPVKGGVAVPNFT